MSETVRVTISRQENSPEASPEPSGAMDISIVAAVCTMNGHH